MCIYTWFELASLAAHSSGHWPMVMISSSLCGHTCYIFDPGTFLFRMGSRILTEMIKTVCQ